MPSASISQNVMFDKSGERREEYFPARIRNVLDLTRLDMLPF
jgi:hypothetical protein